MQLETAAYEVIEAFEALGLAKDTVSMLQARARCGNTLTALKAALASRLNHRKGESDAE